jgi:hypothetical protein
MAFDIRAWVDNVLLTAQQMIDHVNGPLLYLKEWPHKRYTPTAASGTNNSGSAAVAASAVISGMTAEDRLVVDYTIEAAGGDVANVILRNVTDSLDLVSLTAGTTLTGGGVLSGRAVIGARQGSATAIRCRAEGFGTARADDAANRTFTTAITATWTIGLQHGGTAAEFRYRWQVYRLAGQE